MSAIEKTYESETGEKPLYRKGSSDYHTLKYVRWLEEKLTAYQAGKDEHGTVAPSCVGCPTAEAGIEGDWVMVRKARLIATLRNKKIHVYKKVNYFPGVEHVKTISTIEEQLAHLTETEQ